MKYLPQLILLLLLLLHIWLETNLKILQKNKYPVAWEVVVIFILFSGVIQNNEPLIKTIHQFLRDKKNPSVRAEVFHWMTSVLNGYDYCDSCCQYP